MTVMSARPIIVAITVATLVLSACAGSTPSTTPASAAASPSTAAAPTPSATPVPTATPLPTPAETFDPTRRVTAEVVLEGMFNPVDVTNAGDGSGRVFVVEQAGRIKILRDGTLLADTLLDIGTQVACCDEQGLLGLAFHPDFPKDPRFFVDYTDLKGNTVVSSFTVDPKDPDVADPASETVLLHIDQPYPNHNGGAVEFGPDGMLYIAMGDGGYGGDPHGNGQNLGTMLAKILRIDVNDPPKGKTYSVPKDNPFVKTAGAQPEIWLAGLRNPWRMRFDRTTGDLWIGDVGQESWEEIDVARAGVGGVNYGWNRMEGAHCFEPPSGCDQTGLTMPVTEYGHEDGCAVIGGVVVRDTRQGGLDGSYIFGDACSDRLWVIDPTSNGPQKPALAARLGRTLSSIGEAEDGTVYATSLDSGELLRLSGGS